MAEQAELAQEDESDGLSMMQENMEALESGDDAPHDEEMAVSSEGNEDVAESDDQEEVKTGAKHMSREDWESAGNDPDEYMSEKEFDRVADFKETSKLELSRKLARMEGLLTETVKNQSKMIGDAETRARESTIADLKAKQQEAIDTDDTAGALELEREINEQSKVSEKKEAASGELGDAQQKWFDSNNSWYTVDAAATSLMNVELTKAERDGLPVEDGLARAEEKVKKHFAYYFDESETDEAKQKTRPKQMTEKTRRPGRQSERKKTFADLSPEMRGIAKRAAKASGLNEAEYMEMMQ